MTTRPGTQRSRNASSLRRRAPYRYAVEPLEGRALPAAFTVNTFADAAAVNASSGDATSTLGAGQITLRSAIQAADATAGVSTINLPAGTYTLSIPATGTNDAASGDLNITGSLTLTGAGADTTTIDANKIDRVLTVSGTGVVALSGVTITGGDDSVANPAAPGGTGGGGIHLQGATLSLTGCAVVANAANEYGGGGGGGIFNEGGQLTLTESTVASNQVQIKTRGGSGLLGGGIYSAGGTTNVVFSKVFLNQVGSASENSLTVAADGGGIANVAGTLTVTGSTVNDNTANGDYGGAAEGGGVYNNGLATLTNSTFNGNSALSTGGLGDGGGIADFVGTLNVTDCTVVGNQASHNGGGIELDAENINNGAVVFRPSIVIVQGGSIVGSTITKNTAGNDGGGLFDDDPSPFTVKNTILANNLVFDTSGDSNYGEDHGSVTSAGHNLSSDLSTSDVFTAAGDINNVDPNLGPLTDNGGPTFTEALPAGSAAVDAGDPTGAPATDQRGAARIQGTTIDIGAYELGTAQIATATTLAATPDTFTVGQNFTLSYTVRDALGALVPSGMVSINDSNIPGAFINFEPVTNGVGQISGNSLSAGVHTFTVHFFQPNGAGGSSPVYAPSDSNTVTVTVRPSISTSTASPTAGQPVTFGSVVTTVESGVPPAGRTVTFNIDGQNRPPVPVTVVGNQGSASLTVSDLAAGAHQVYATFNGTNHLGASNSAMLALIVAPSTTPTPTTIAVTPPGTLSVGTVVPVLATLNLPPGATGTPTGTVTLSVDGKPGQVVNLVQGQVPAFTLPILPAGAHHLVASYSGDPSFVASVSPAVTFTVIADPTVTSLTSAPNPSTAGQSVTFTAEVTPQFPVSALASRAVVTSHAGAVHARQVTVPPGFPPLAGVVVFKDGSVVLAVVPVHADGTATFTTASLLPGRHPITATYGRDPNYALSTSAIDTQTVTGAADGPRVVSVLRYGYHTMPTTLVVGFNAPLNAATARNATNYRIIDDHGRFIPVSLAVYNPGAGTVTLYPVTQLDLHKRYTLVIIGSKAGGVTGTSGALLDGASTGRPGSNFVTTVDAANLVVTNPFAPGASAALKLAAWARAHDRG